MGLRDRHGKWHYRFTLDGREYTGNTDLAAIERNRKAAELIELEFRQALLEGRHPNRRLKICQFEEAAKIFLEWAETEHRDHPNTYRRLATSFASLREFFGTVVVSLVDENKVDEYKAWRIKKHDVRPVTLRHDMHAFSKFFKFAIRNHWYRENPMKLVKIPSDADAVRIHVISPKEEKKYFRWAVRYPDLHDVGRLMLNQGMRPEEVVALRKDDVDLFRGQLHVRKGKTKSARRTLDLISESHKILAHRILKAGEWLFPSRRLPGQHVKRLNTTHDKVCEKAGLNFVLYDFRHSFATRMAQAGVDLATLAAILGHSSIRIVERYVHITAEHRRQAMRRYEKAVGTARYPETVQ